MRDRTELNAFVENIIQQQKNREAYEKLSDAEKEQITAERKQEAELLDQIVYDATGVRPSWYR